jgi:hypothetical protein
VLKSLCHPSKDLGPYGPHVTQVKIIGEVVAVMWRSIYLPVVCLGKISHKIAQATVLFVFL